VGRAALAMPPAPVHLDASEANVEQPTTKTCKYGRSTYCRACTAQRSREHKAANRDAINARAVENYRRRNADKIAACAAAIQLQLSATSKVCRRCHVEKPIDDFYRNPKSRDGHTSYCKACIVRLANNYHDAHRAEMNAKGATRYAANRDELNAARRAARAADPESHRRKKREANRRTAYGLSPEQVAEMLAGQGGCCAICGTDITGSHPYRGEIRTNTCVDHDHVAGAVRGLLCHGCNQALGIWRDDPAFLRAALDYLTRFAVV
jgi:hypothetical protein